VSLPCCDGTCDKAAKLLKCFLWPAEGTCPGRPSLAKTLPELLVSDQFGQGVRNRRRFGLTDPPAIPIDDLNCSTHVRCHHGQAGPEGLDEDEAKRLGTGVGLAENIGSLHQPRNVIAFPKQLESALWQSGGMGGDPSAEAHLRGPGGTAHKKRPPSEIWSKMPECTDMEELALPFLETTDLEDSHIVRSQPEFCPCLLPFEPFWS